MSRTSAGQTDVGRKRRLNEDSFLVDDAIGFYVVADGMGGHAAGEVASREAVDAAHAMVRRESGVLSALDAGDDSPKTLRRAVRLIESAVQGATYMVFGIAQHDPSQRGMGTTVSALALAGRWGFTAQVGDSRIYLIRDGQASPLTEDHTLVAWQLKRGVITEDEARTSPHRNVITRAVGSRDYVEVDTRCFEVKPGDHLLLCSDGLHGYLDDEEIPKIARGDLVLAVQQFIDTANERGGRDNITAILVRVD